MMPKSEKSQLIFYTIGWPIGNGTATPRTDVSEAAAEFAFKDRISLLFIEECVNGGVTLGPKALELHGSLMAWRLETDRVGVKLARKLHEVAKHDWVLFKSIKPFA